MKVICFIPCRYNSSRLPGKPLLKINNKTIIRLVYEQVKKARTIDQIIVLTDDSRIKEEVDSFAPHGACFMTGNASNGTERIVNFIKKAYGINFHMILLLMFRVMNHLLIQKILICVLKIIGIKKTK